ncbi:hypothetical protein [Roseomonas fluvialis]|uniref:Uncharacterized protein n=1 Tax=Roseomonas fluvialis TaxID=1750527 RepID=A0ABN6P4Y4_9PROT|nr:hypothetical protein [Roseomonas fluvialis]BDG73717.1 hypothetical protein Rmf_36460 [Roseomonas fluvialis]
MTRRLLMLCALLAAPVAALAQAVPVPPPVAASRALTQEAMRIFEATCLPAALRGEAVPPIVARDFGTAAAAVPPDQLRGNDAVRETGAWLITGLHGRYRLNTIEPGGQCGLLAEGVDHDSFLGAAAQIMARAPEVMPGWTLDGTPQRTSGARPFGTLTYVSATFSRADAPPPAPVRLLSITASAAERTDGRPNTGVVSVAIREERR